ncbi:MAG: FAD-dependent oxidoreductase, partial [Chloroflexota bacterium]
MPHASVIGSGPNGLAAAITLAQAGWSVTLYEAKATVGGGLRTAELTLPGFHHDICSAIHPLGISSPFFKSLPLANYGLEWIYPEVNVAHPFDDGTAAYIARTWEETADSIGADGRGWRQLFEPLAANWDGLVRDFLRPIINIPRSPFTLAYFGLHAIQSA